MDPFKNPKGFTLIEIIFAIFIGLMLLSAIYVSMISGQKSSVAIDRKVAAQQDVRSALEIMAVEIGMASYNPTFASGIWRDGPATLNCGTPAANQAIKGIQEATANSITVEMDVGGAGAIENGGNGAIENDEILRYAWDQANQRITRGTNCGADESFIGDTAGNQRSVRVINDILGITNPHGFPAIFRYFNGRGIELFPDENPNDIPNIRRIDFTLGVETDEVDPNTQQRRRMIYSSSVIVRNHSINL